VQTAASGTEDRAYQIAASVPDPELPMLTLADLGMLRRVRETGDGVCVVITPTYSGCPALATMRDDLMQRLTAAGYRQVRVEVELAPAWSTDQITARGRQALAAAGISPPGAAPARPAADPVPANSTASGAPPFRSPALRPAGPIPLTLTPVRRSLSCPRCGSRSVALVSEFGATACTALYRCQACLEPFWHMREV
jgi:ring-1,2-phenylacetyl-CoA epoxidase subunit PaaD